MHTITDAHVNVYQGRLNRLGRRSEAAMQRKQAMQNRLFNWQQHNRRIRESKAAARLARNERIRHRREQRIKMEEIGKRGVL